MSVPITIFGSGTGTNFDAILAATREGRLGADIRCVVSDQPDAPILAKARAAGIPVLAIAPPDKGAGLSAVERRESHERAILERIAEHSPRFLVLAGYMRIMSSVLLDAFRSERGYRRIVNVHPSLLPAFPGVESYRQAFESGVRVSGVTVHLVDEGVDTGPICAQESFTMGDCASVDQVRARGQIVEHHLYPATLNWVLPEDFDFQPSSSAQPLNKGKIIVR